MIISVHILEKVQNMLTHTRNIDKTVMTLKAQNTWGFAEDITVSQSFTNTQHGDVHQHLELSLTDAKKLYMMLHIIIQEVQALEDEYHAYLDKNV